MPAPRALVVGGGITGLAAAVTLIDGGAEIELWEAGSRLGGKIAGSPFGGLDQVDESADAFLTRVPAAVEFATRVGLDDAALTAPTDAHAAVWHGDLHPIPNGIMMGVPAALVPLATSSLLTWRGKLRAAFEPALPRSRAALASDSLGTLVRARFGNEVHDRLVDALVGSIYATDTDRTSLASVAQIAGLTRHRSLLLGAVALRRSARAAAAKPGGAIFAAPRAGMTTLIDAAMAAVLAGGGTIHTGRAAGAIAADGDGWRVDDEPFDHIVLASPAAATAPLLHDAAPDAAAALAAFEHVGIAMVRLAVPDADWPTRLHGRSGYLVPKSVQRTVTAASFGSQKWAHWRPPSGDQILRVSLGRDGLPIEHLDEAALVGAAVDEVGTHLGFDLAPRAASVTRWTAAFPQYRPGHHLRVEAVTRCLPARLHLAGASYRGIGIPACIADGTAAAEKILRSARP